MLMLTDGLPTVHNREDTEMTERVQIPVYTDRWMRGDRYGEVVKVETRTARVVSKPGGQTIEREIAYVKLDKSGKTIRVIYSDCIPV
jgi:fructose 1,6-bisphosphatase